MEQNGLVYLVDIQPTITILARHISPDSVDSVLGCSPHVEKFLIYLHNTPLGGLILAFKKVGAVILLVSSMEKSVKFYKDTLGLQMKNKSKDWTEFFKDGTVLALTPAKRKSMVHSGTGMLVGFMVSDMDQTVKELKAKRVKFFKKPKDEPFGKHAVIEDPDGHLISIAEIKMKSDEGFDMLGMFGTD